MASIEVLEEMGFKAVSTFHTANEFSQYIELCAVESDQTVLEVLMQYLNETGIEEIKIKPLISKSLENKLRECAIDLGLMRGEANNLADFL